MTQEHKNNISKALKGRKLTKKWKKRISESHKGLIGTNSCNSKKYTKIINYKNNV